ncbi:FecCD family ABC transporter permease [Tistrella mobilis]|uniref:ABC-type Fe3+-siderophore transport system, permease component n=1 Tax=Tistrella mobilis (strain KA081020-065) TaxID=1110502 RepID=I3TK85_TISMK|nr:iron ABC transporter permease [Tistrella mobilis]AFK53173.1 putative ABC-type Fe3+-siderophore transport system, permease component [Tistrella mobilis KA081020-065]
MAVVTDEASSSPGMAGIVDARARARRRMGTALVIALLAVAVAALATGPLAIAPADYPAVAQALMVRFGWIDPAAVDIARADQVKAAVLMDIRLPRLILGLMVGGVLGLSGAVLQGLFRNPLADPGLIGVSSGAALFAVAAIVLGHALVPALPGWAAAAIVPVAAFCGAIAATMLVWRLAGGAAVDGAAAGQDMSLLLLAGVAISAIAAAGVGLFSYIGDDQQLRELTFWAMGGLGGARWGLIWAPAIAIAIAAWLLLPLARPLDAHALGDQDAYHLGIDGTRLRRRAVIGAALGVGAAVAVSGTISFVGLVVPHLVRLAVGPAHRGVLPLSVLAGAVLLVGADLPARLVAAPAELPIGIVTALIGGPYFIHLLRARIRGGGI